MSYLLYDKLKGMKIMFIEIYKADTPPIYIQLMQQLKKLIVQGQI